MRRSTKSCDSKDKINAVDIKVNVMQLCNDKMQGKPKKSSLVFAVKMMQFSSMEVDFLLLRQLC